jgi:biopolymer transport protein ExbB
MQAIIDAYEAIRDFLELGGPILRLIAIVILVMWILILERLIFFRTTLNRLIKEAFNEWERRKERRSWHARQIREGIISRVRMQANEGLPIVQTLVALCPLFGLLGTVTGMIAVFDVMSFSGGGSARALASGVSMATVPTMAGMVAALSGVYFAALLEHKAQVEADILQDLLQSS